MSAAAYAMASVELVQPHDSTWLMPRRRSENEISLDIIPTIEIGSRRDDLAAVLDEEVVILSLTRRCLPRRCR